MAAELIGLQNGPCDVACIYDARCGVGPYSSLFNPLTQKPHRTYYAFCAFGELFRLGTAVKVSVTGDGADRIYAVAARGADGRQAALIVNYASKATPVSISGGVGVPRCRIIDEGRVYKEIPQPSVLPPHSVLLVLIL